MSISSPMPEHPLLAAARGIEAVLDDVAGTDPLYLTVEEKSSLLMKLTRSMGRLAGLRAQVLAAAEDVATEKGARSPATWLAAETRTSRREATYDERLGGALRHRWRLVGEAATSGRVIWEQVGVLVTSLEALPDGLDAELVGKAEAYLVAEAGHFGPRELRRLGRHVLEVVAPEIADEQEERALRAEEQRARRLTRLSFRPRGDGSTDVFARLPDHVASRLRAYLDAYTSPRRIRLDATQAVHDVEMLRVWRRRGEAFCALLENVPADGLPSHGGTATSVMVTIDIDSLRSGLGLADTSTGDTITATEARRMACTAGILPVVLGGAGEILDLGRSRRLFSPAQRKALTIRDRRCRAEGCDIPAAWCEAHHATEPWTRGGRTDLDDGLLLCSFHHHRSHDARYDASRLPNGDIRYARRT
jgi:hypothetical protein